MRCLILKFLCFLIIIFDILNNSFSQAAELTGAKATFPQPVAWAYQYYKQTKVKINYQGIGSGGGIRQAQEKNC